MTVRDDSLRRLMAASQAGDKRAYAVLLDQVQGWLQRYFARKIAPDRVDDLVQDTLMALHHKRASYDPARPFLPWLAAIARYRWVDRLRQDYRQATEELGDHDAAQDDHEDVVGAQISIDRLLAGLTEGQAAALRCVKIDGLSIREASALTGQSEALVKVNIHRAMNRLSQMIESD